MTEALREISFVVDNARGDPVHGDVRFVEDESPTPVVVFCHGFKGVKDWGPFPTWGRRLARAGVAAVPLYRFVERCTSGCPDGIHGAGEVCSESAEP